jgi:hypothetical protein
LLSSNCCKLAAYSYQLWLPPGLAPTSSGSREKSCLSMTFVMLASFRTGTCLARTAEILVKLSVLNPCSCWPRATRYVVCVASALCVLPTACVQQSQSATNKRRQHKDTVFERIFGPDPKKTKSSPTKKKTPSIQNGTSHTFIQRTSMCSQSYKLTSTVLIRTT